MQRVKHSWRKQRWSHNFLTAPVHLTAGHRLAFPLNLAFLSFQEISMRNVDAVFAQVISLCNFPKTFQLRHSAARISSNLISPLDGRKTRHIQKRLTLNKLESPFEDSTGY